MRLLSRIWMWLRALVRHDASWPYTRSIATTDMSAVTKRAKNRPQHKASIASTETWVKLPDLFQSFLKDPPPVNPHYETVRIESEQWLSNFCDFPADLIKRVHKCDFSYFCAIVAPYAPADRFRILCDWGNWIYVKVFPYDDMFDVDGLTDPEMAQGIMDSLFSPFDGTTTAADKKLPIVQAHENTASRMFSKCSPGIKQRYLRKMHEYSHGVLAHLNSFARLEPNSLSLEKKIESRRNSAGVSPIYHLAEYAHDLEIPDEVFESPVIRKLEVLGMDMVFITNDILSYRKEEGVPDNMIAACRLNGLSAQEAFDTAGEMLEYRYRSWEKTEANVPSWGEATDIQVGQYIEAIKATVKANLYWSYRSDRYLGRDANQVRRDRRIRVMETPPYLQR